MRVINSQSIKQMMTILKIKKNLQNRINFSFLDSIPDSEWARYELLSAPTKDNTAGVLLIDIKGSLYATSYEINMMRSLSTGRSVPIICDFCKTWQAGANAGSVTFSTYGKSLGTVTYLCCLDLKCSLNVRGLTKAAKLSRVQLRETISDSDRILRLEKKLLLIVGYLRLQPVPSTKERGAEI